MIIDFTPGRLSSSGTKAPKSQGVIFPMQKNPIVVNTFLKRLQDSKTFDEFYKIWNNYHKSSPNAEFLDPNFIKDKGFYLKANLPAEAENLEYTLKNFKKKGFTISPEFVRTINTDSGLSVTLMHLPRCEQGKMLDFKQNYNLLSQIAKEKAYKDFRQLNDMEIVNLDVMLDSGALKITPQFPHQIVCEDWSSVVPLNEYRMNYEPQSSSFEVLHKYYNKIFKNK